jgi:hypothetical protein
MSIIFLLIGLSLVVGGFLIWRLQLLDIIAGYKWLHDAFSSTENQMAYLKAWSPFVACLMSNLKGSRAVVLPENPLF